MYRQIQVDQRDINYQRIIWQPASSKSPNEYQLLIVTYGMTCAPFLALRVLKQLAEDEGRQYPLAASVLRDNIYVDDVLFGADDSNHIKEIREQLNSLLKLGGFELRKWASNSPSLVADINSADHGLACNKQLSDNEQLKILGIGWSPVTDSFEFGVSLQDIAPNTKRSILSAIAKLYDPLGWVTPVTITAKIFMQQLWRSKLSWDDVTSETLFSRWKEIYFRLQSLENLKIPRWSGCSSNITPAKLHGFADASTCAYAAVIYLKVISQSNHVNITLLAAKSKVAPLKPLNIPRLELSAALFLTRVMDFVREALDYSHLPCYCWTDSTIVLAWINQHPSRWKTFVANRVTEIQSNLPNAEWHHVATEDNPADCASRGIFGDEIVTQKLWWYGPH